MDIKEIAERVSKRIYVEDGLLLSKFISEKFAESLIEAYKAELLKEAGEPVAVTNHAQLGYVTDGMHPDIPLAMWAKETSYSGANIALYTSEQVAAAILKATKPLIEERDRAVKRMKAGWIEVCDSGILAFKEMNDELRTQLTAAQEEIKTVTEQKNRMWFEMQTAQDQLAKAEQRVAEACAAYVLDDLDGFEDGDCIAEAIRSGEWRKFVKEV